MIVTLTVNGERVAAEVVGWESLLWMLRNRLELPGSKPACEQGECGACSVIMDGKLVCSCLVMSADADGTEVVTVEGLGSPDRPHRVQEVFAAEGAVQCGYCTPGLVVATAHLLDTGDDPSAEDVREALSGNLCRCTGYGAILRSVSRLVEERRL